MHLVRVADAIHRGGLQHRHKFRRLVGSGGYKLASSSWVVLLMEAVVPFVDRNSGAGSVVAVAFPLIALFG